MRHFYVPLFHEFCRTQQVDPASVRVLDCGCGNGISVECLRRAGFVAYGIDAEAFRCEQWKEPRRLPGILLCRADALHLPFTEASFDIVFSCGLLEHIGVAEWADPEYHVVATPDQPELRRLFIRESLRVLRRPGVLYLDHPNGAFPIDFWHSDSGGRPRFHRPSEKFLPSFREVCELVRAADPSCFLEALSPAGRFVFRRATRHWYGKIFRGPLQLYFEMLRYRPFAWLAGTPLNPFLVLRITRH